MVDLRPFKKEIENARQALPDVCRDPKGTFLDMLLRLGYDTPKAFTIGELQRVDGPEDKKGKKSGWFVYNEIADTQEDGHIIGIASYGDWKTGESHVWSSRSEHKMSNKERLNYHAMREGMRLQREADKIKTQEESASIAYDIWVKSPQANNEHEYLERKGVIAAKGVKLSQSDQIIVPVAVNNQVTSLQFINKDGSKKFLSGGKIKGGWFMIEGENSDIIYIAEGYSTATSIHMATGKTVYVAFNAGNIYEVATHVKNENKNKRIIIAGDDDFENNINSGRIKAEQAASGLDLECIFPKGFVDFNDMHHALGIKALTEYLEPTKITAYEKKKKKKDEVVPHPDGFLGDVIDYYNATSGNKQYGFAIQTALALASIILARNYITTYQNLPSIYLLNVGKSGTGKEHSKTIIEKVLYKANLSHLIAGDGYTSAGAVFSTLLFKPKHISVIDEFGRYLEAGKNLGGGTSHQREANTKLMESIGRGHSVMRPASYSSMTKKKEEADAIKDRFIHNPAITLLTMTTPDTLFKTLDMGAIKDGFINRFIISISDAERIVRKHKPPIEVPDRIIDWIDKVLARCDNTHISIEPAKFVTIDFEQTAIDAQFQFQEYCITKANDLEKFGMSEITARTNEMAMKLSLIHALSRDPNTSIIYQKDMNWAIEYMRLLLDETVERLKITISHSSYEGDKKEVLQALRDAGKHGITWATMQKKPPFSKFKKKDLVEILGALKDADLAADEPYKPPTGRPSVKWIALK